MILEPVGLKKHNNIVLWDEYTTTQVTSKTLALE